MECAAGVTIPTVEIKLWRNILNPQPGDKQLVMRTITSRANAYSFTDLDRYDATVKEVAGSDPGYAYDSATHAVVVTVTDTNGVLSETWTVDGETDQRMSSRQLQAYGNGAGAADHQDHPVRDAADGQGLHLHADSWVLRQCQLRTF